MEELLRKQDVLDAIFEATKETEVPDVILGLGAAMSVVKLMPPITDEYILLHKDSFEGMEGKQNEQS